MSKNRDCTKKWTYSDNTGKRRERENWANITHEYKGCGVYI